MAIMGSNPPERLSTSHFAPQGAASLPFVLKKQASTDLLDFKTMVKEDGPKIRVDGKGKEWNQPSGSKKVGTFARRGMTQKQIAAELGIKPPFTLSNRLVKVSQATGKPVPPFRYLRKRKHEKRIEPVEVKRRGKRDAFGLNIPQEPLIRGLS